MHMNVAKSLISRPEVDDPLAKKFQNSETMGTYSPHRFSLMPQNATVPIQPSRTNLIRSAPSGGIHDAV